MTRYNLTFRRDVNERPARKPPVTWTQEQLDMLAQHYFEEQLTVAAIAEKPAFAAFSAVAIQAAIKRNFSPGKREERRFIRGRRNKYTELLPAAEVRGLTVRKLADRLMDIICAEPSLVNAILDDGPSENINGTNFAAGERPSTAAPG
jgi:hypothetical protein